MSDHKFCAAKAREYWLKDKSKKIKWEEQKWKYEICSGTLAKNGAC